MPEMIPVGNTVTPPSPQQGLGMLSSLYGLQQQKLAIQTGQAGLQTAQATAQQAGQQNQELQALAAFTKNAANDPAYLNDDGTPNVQKYQQGAMSVAPTYGQAYIGNATANFTGAVNNRSALLKLSNAQRQTAGGYLAAEAANTDANAESFKAMTQKMRDVSSDPGYQSAVDSLLMHAPNTMTMPTAQASNALRSFARQVAVQTGAPGAALSAPATSDYTTPGGAIGQRQTNVMSPMGTGPVGHEVPQGIAPAIGATGGGQPAAISSAGVRPLPVVAGASPTPSPANRLQPLQQPAPNAPAAQWQNYNAQIKASSDLLTGARNAANDPMNGVQATRFRNQQIMDLIPHAETGPGLKLLNTLASRLPGSTGDAYQDLEHYTAQNSAALAQKMGVPNTNLGAETAAAAAGNAERNPGALAEITKTNDALNTAFDLFNRGLSKVSNNGSDPSRVNAYQQAFGQNLDINAIRWADAHRRGDTQELDHLNEQLGPSGIAAAQQKLKTLKALSDTGDLPQ